jgi:hypothetical protein
MSTPKNYILRDIPADLWRQVKVEAATEGVSVREVILRGLREYAPASAMMVYPCQCGHEKGDHQMRIGQRGNYTPCCISGCGCDGFKKDKKERTR